MSKSRNPLQDSYPKIIPQAPFQQQAHMAEALLSDSLLDSFCNQKQPSKQNNFWQLFFSTVQEAKEHGFNVLCEKPSC